MRRQLAVVVALWLLAVVSPAQETAAPPADDVLFQTSTIGALLVGVYDGDMSLGELREHGDFGIGTVNALDGELIELDGAFVSVTGDGRVHLLPGLVRTPFAAVTFFEADDSFPVQQVSSYEQLQGLIDARLPTPNICYAVRVRGVFSSVRTRSVPAQSRPYPPLAEVVKNQTVFELPEVTGTLVGFRLPGFVSGLNVPGWHVHFLADDLSNGGHLLECAITNAVVEIDYTRGLCVALPGTEDFAGCDASGERKQELEQVEQEKH